MEGEPLWKVFEKELQTPEKEPPCKCVVRLTTTCWHNQDGIQIKKTLRFMKRQCQGHNILLEDAQMIGANEVIDRIINLYEIKDGLYDVVTCNESRCWETNNLDDYDYKLIPLK